MPMASEAQRRLFWAVKGDPKLGRKLGISQAVAGDFTKADTGGSLPERVKSKTPEERWYGASGSRG
jgi:hypothetical protein